MHTPKAYHIPSHVTEIILESISDGVFTVDHELGIELPVTDGRSCRTDRFRVAKLRR